MKYPKLVPKNVCRTDIHVKLYGEGIDEEGSQKVAHESDQKCNYQDSAEQFMTVDRVLVRISGTALFHADFCPEIQTISAGEALIHGAKRKIARGQKARNPDGSVNYVRLDFE